MVVSLTSIAGRPKDPRVRQFVVELLRRADPPMMSIPMIRRGIEAEAGIRFSWGAVANHLGDLEAQGFVRRLEYARSKEHKVRYRVGKKAGRVETRTRTHAWFQLADRFKAVDGLNWR